MTKLTLTPSNKLCDPDVETTSDRMMYQLGFCHKLDNYKDNWNSTSHSQEELDSIRKLIYEVDNYIGSNTMLKKFDEWVELDNICDECGIKYEMASCNTCNLDFCATCECGGDDNTPEMNWVCDGCYHCS